MIFGALGPTGIAANALLQGLEIRRGSKKKTKGLLQIPRDFTKGIIGASRDA